MSQHRYLSLYHDHQQSRIRQKKHVLVFSSISFSIWQQLSFLEFRIWLYIQEDRWTWVRILHKHNCTSVEDCARHKISFCLIFFLLHSQVKINWHYFLIDFTYSVYLSQPVKLEGRMTIHNLFNILNYYQSVS